MWRAADGNLYVILGDRLKVGMYYNKDLFDGLRLKEPSNWEDPMRVVETLRRNDVTLMAMYGNNLNQVTWIAGCLTNRWYRARVRGHDANKDGRVSKREIVLADKNGTYSFRRERSLEQLQRLKRMYEYAQPGFPGTDQGIARRLFLTGRAAM